MKNVPAVSPEWVLSQLAGMRFPETGAAYDYMLRLFGVQEQLVLEQAAADASEPTAEEVALKACRMLSDIGAASEDGPHAAKVAESLRQSAHVMMTEVGVLRDAADAIEAQAERLERHASALAPGRKMEKKRLPCICGDGSCMFCDDDGMTPGEVW